MPQEPAVLIASGSNWDSPARLPRVFKEAGCRVHVFCSPDWALAQTRFVDVVHDAPTDLTSYADALKQHVDKHRQAYSWIVVVDDPLLTTLATTTDSDWLASWFPVSPVSPWLDIVASKIGFTNAARQALLPIPRSAVCDSKADARGAAETIGFPVVLKKSASYAGMGVRAADGLAALEAAYDELSDGTPLLLQKFINGPIGNTVFLFDHGVPRCWMSAYKVRTWPGPFGPSTARRFTTHPSVEPMLNRLGALTGYHGFGALDWVHDDVSGQLVFIEMNARPVPTIHLGPQAGVNFSEAIRAMLAGKTDVQRQPSTSSSKRIVPMFPEDCYRASTESSEATFDEWLPKRGGYCDVPWDDPPLIAYHRRRRVVRKWLDKLDKALAES